MTKYRAKVDVPPGIKAGDVVDFKDPLVPGYVPLFDKADDGDELTNRTAGDNLNSERTATINPSLDVLKAHLEELGIEFRDDLTVIELFQLLSDAEAKRLSGDGGQGSDGGEDDGGEDKSGAPDRNDLKARATELGINFASNIPTDRLVELVKEAEDKKNGE